MKNQTCIDWIGNETSNSFSSETKSKSRPDWSLWWIVISHGFHCIIRTKETGTEDNNTKQTDSESLVQSSESKNKGRALVNSLIIVNTKLTHQLCKFVWHNRQYLWIVFRQLIYRYRRPFWFWQNQEDRQSTMQLHQPYHQWTTFYQKISKIQSFYYS